MKKIVEDFLRPFTPAEVSILMTLAMHMELYGLTATDVIAACETYNTEMIESLADMPPPIGAQSMPKIKRPRIINLKCPVCESVVSISLVNTGLIYRNLLSYLVSNYNSYKYK